MLSAKKREVELNNRIKREKKGKELKEAKNDSKQKQRLYLDMLAKVRHITAPWRGWSQAKTIKHQTPRLSLGTPGGKRNPL